MELNDYIQILMLLVSAIAIIVSAWMSMAAIKASMEMVKEQNQIQMFAEYTSRFQDIVLAMPKSVFDGTGVVDQDVLRYMQLYFNLCSEEFDLKTRDAINSDVWEKWRMGMATTFNLPLYQQSWEVLKEGYSQLPAFVDFINSLIKNQKDDSIPQNV
jgi:hypothetical protein